MIKIFNTFGKKLENFVPIDKNHVKIYVCGPTVYDRIHIGNARPLVVFDTLVRLLRSSYKKVTYVRNITDVDDKINKKSFETGKPINEITSETIKHFHVDCNKLKNISPDFEPKATDHIKEMVELIDTLIEKDFAYEKSGNVFFRVKNYEHYGRLSHRTIDEMQAGARVEVSGVKENSADFTLWKPSSKDLPGWDSPWGRGRPGWHIECSAMSKKYLGETFDIHGGGADLIFPHHENEIAQSCCANNKQLMAKYWVHNGYVNLDQKKMSKSLGNFKTIYDLLKKFNGEVIRYFLLQAHYRAPLNFKQEYILEAKSSLSRLYRSIKGFEKNGDPDNEILFHLKNDLNTPKAFARAHFLSEQSNKGSREAGQLLKNSSALLGILEDDTETWFKNNPIDLKIEYQLTETNIENMIEDRRIAKENKDFKAADKIRDNLLNNGIVLEDNLNGTSWRRS